MRPNRKRFRRRVKVCRFTVEKINYIDYKDVDLLREYTPTNGKILPRRITGVSALFQRRVTRAVKRARHLALLPFVAVLVAVLPAFVSPPLPSQVRTTEAVAA